MWLEPPRGLHRVERHGAQVLRTHSRPTRVGQLISLAAVTKHPPGEVLGDAARSEGQRAHRVDDGQLRERLGQRAARQEADVPVTVQHSVTARYQHTHTATHSAR